MYWRKYSMFNIKTNVVFFFSLRHPICICQTKSNGFVLNSFHLKSIYNWRPTQSWFDSLKRKSCGSDEPFSPASTDNRKPIKLFSLTKRYVRFSTSNNMQKTLARIQCQNLHSGNQKKAEIKLFFFCVLCQQKMLVMHRGCRLGLVTPASH